MTDSWAITRELPAGENTPVMASIKMEDSIADEGAGPRPQPGLSRDVERSGWRRKSLRHAGGGLQEIGGVHDEDGSNLGTKAPVDYSMMQERHHGSFNPLTPAGYVLTDQGAGHASQPPNFLGHSLLIGGEVLERWRHAGSAQGLTSDNEIASFLLEFWGSVEGTHSRRSKTPDAAHLCSTCQTPLTLVCLTCNPAQIKHNSIPSHGASSQVCGNSIPCSDSDGNHVEDDDTEEDVPLTMNRSAESLENETAKSSVDQRLREWRKNKDSSIAAGSRAAIGSTKRDSDLGPSLATDPRHDRFSETCFVKVVDIATKQAVQTLEEEALVIPTSKALTLSGVKKKKPGRKKNRVRRSNTQKLSSSGTRRVGRPRKQQPVSITHTLDSDAMPEEVRTKRGRGRPKKEPHLEQPENGDAAERPWKCAVCAKAFKDQSNCRVHELGHSRLEKRHKCEHCPAAFRSPANLRAHSRKHTGERPFFCETCGKAFARTTTLEQHRRVHTNDRPYKCEQCGEAFKQRGLLIVHRRKAHTFERPFSCTICAASFVVKGHLSVHMQCHTGLRPFLCEECGASFKQKGILKVHKMIHKGERPFSCDECGKSFYRQVDVRAHKKTHLNIRNIICTVCGAAFGNNSTLKRHMQMHTGFRPFNCSDCGKKFASNSELKVHQRIHTGHKPYICDICDRGFQTMGNMKKHRNNRHKHAPPYVAPTQKMGLQMREDQRVEAYVSASQKAEPLSLGTLTAEPSASRSQPREPFLSVSRQMEGVAASAADEQVEPVACAGRSAETFGYVVHQAEQTNSVVQKAEPMTSVVQKAEPMTSEVQKAEPMTSVVFRTAPMTSLVHRAEPMTSLVHRAEPMTSLVHRAEPFTSTGHKGELFATISHRNQPFSSLVPRLYPYASASLTLKKCSSDGET